ncbi:MAG: PAS domain S-box protein [Betaproteobacteria bacterium]|nr:PAS domain S-box protein [Betaproteobacteria bacterium]
MLKTKSVFALQDGSRYLVSGTVDITRQTQAALEIQRGKDFLEAMVNAIPQPLFVKNRDKRFVLANRAASSDWGLKPQEQIGRSDFDLMDAGHARQVQDEDEQVFRSGQVMLFEDHWDFPGRGTKWSLKSKCPVELPDGSQYIVGLATDISALKATEQALRRSEARLSVLNEVAGAMARSAAMDEVIEIAVVGLVRYLPGFGATYEKVVQRCHLEVTHSVSARNLPDLKGMRFDLRQWPKYHAALQTNSLLVCGNIREEELWDEVRDFGPGQGDGAILQVRLDSGGEWVGLLSLRSANAHQWAQNEIGIVSEVTEYLRIALREAAAASAQIRTQDELR